LLACTTTLLQPAGRGGPRFWELTHPHLLLPSPRAAFFPQLPILLFLLLLQHDLCQQPLHLPRLTQWVSGGRSAHSAAAAAAVSYQGAPAIKSAGPSEPSAPAMAGEFWINLFGSCVMEQEPQPNRQRPKISRDMIGQPTNFRHTSHVGSSDIGEISSLQSTMKGKGDEELQHIQVPHIMNARSIHELKRTSLKA